MAKAKKDKPEETPVVIHHFEGTKEERLQKLYDQWYKCDRCQLCQWRVTEDIVFASGNPNAGVMLVGEAPGEDEAEQLIPFVGRSGKLLNQLLSTVAPDQSIKDLGAWYSKVAHGKANETKFHDEMFKWREKNLFVTNIVACRPPENRAPIPPEMLACRERLLNIIYIVDPVVIIASGKTAAEALVGKKIEITVKMGELMDMEIDGRVGPLKYPVLLTLHPSYLARKADWNTPNGDYAKTLGHFMRAMKMYDFLMEQSYGTPPPARGFA